MTTDLIMQVNARTITTTTTAALEARNLNIANQVYIVDYYHYRLFTAAVSSIARTHDMLSRKYLLLLLRIAVVSSICTPRDDPFSEKQLPRNPKSKIVADSRFSDVFFTSRT